MQNSLFVKKNSILLSLTLLAGFSANNSSAFVVDTLDRAVGVVRRNPTIVAGIAAVFHASTKDAEKAPFSVLRPTEITSAIKDLIAAKQYKAAAYLIAKFVDDAVIGCSGKAGGGLKPVGSSVVVTGENSEGIPALLGGTQVLLYEKNAVKPYGIVGVSWAKAKQLLEVLEALGKAHKTVEDFGKLLA